MTSVKIFNRYEVTPGITVDSHRAVWIKETGTLAIADLHLGYAWAHRHAGNLVPLVEYDNLPGRIASLLEDYPEVQQMVFLGDIVHRAVPVEAVRLEFMQIIEYVTARAPLRMILGNHDRRLPQLFDQWSIPIPFAMHYTAGRTTFVHGDIHPVGCSPFVVMGHEHPVIALGDGIATRAYCPCFLSGPSLLVLPAFTRWSSERGDFRSGRFLSPLASQAKFERVVAILGNRLLPLPV